MFVDERPVARTIIVKLLRKITDKPCLSVHKIAIILVYKALIDTQSTLANRRPLLPSFAFGIGNLPILPSSILTTKMRRNVIMWKKMITFVQDICGHSPTDVTHYRIQQ